MTTKTSSELLKIEIDRSDANVAEIMDMADETMASKFAAQAAAGTPEQRAQGLQMLAKNIETGHNPFGANATFGTLCRAYDIIASTS